MHVADHATGGPKRDLVEALGAHYHSGDAADVDIEADVVVECTGAGSVVHAAGRKLTSGGIMCLTGIMTSPPTLDVDDEMNRAMVLQERGDVRQRQRRAPPLAPGGTLPWRRPIPRARRPDHAERPAGGLQTTALYREPDDIKVVVNLQA